MSSLAKHSPYQDWLPSPEIRRAFLREKVTKARERKGHLGDEEIHYTHPVEDFKNAIFSDCVMLNLLKRIFLQVNVDSKWVDHHYVVVDFATLFILLDDIVNEPPKYYNAKQHDGTVIHEPVTVPLYLVFDMLSNTSAAYDLFRYVPFNLALKQLLDSWGRFLQTSDSASSLNSTAEGWFSEESINAYNEVLTPKTFDTTYYCPDPSAENKGFTSWDDFFTRTFLDEARPIQVPNNSNFIHNPCESSFLRFATNVRLHDTFWVKGQNYSLYDMLNRNNEDAEKFVGGTVYQGFVGPRDFHRWHSPVDGVITKIVNVPGTYYAVLPDDGAPANDPDLKQGDPHGALIRSQPWLSMSAARALVFIQPEPTPEGKDVGLICFIAIGMGEISTCEVTVKTGDWVEAGCQLGMFHFGGSAYAMVFPPGVDIVFPSGMEPYTHLLTNKVLGEVRFPSS